MARAEPRDERPQADDRGDVQRYGTIVVVGGGCYGAYYVRQLRRAAERAALKFDRLVVVDRDPACAVSREPGADVQLRALEWRDFFAGWLADEAIEGDAIVPSPLMPHLLFQWLEHRAREQWPARRVEVRTPSPIAGVPWQRVGSDGTRYVSFAEWTCPVNCIEPRTCPHTRGERTWSLPPSLTAHLQAARAAGEPLDGPAIFHCTHRAYGVGMIDVADVLGAARALSEAAVRGPANLLVGTVSHCHGALGVLRVD
jgi:hypothetical protein